MFKNIFNTYETVIPPPGYEEDSFMYNYSTPDISDVGLDITSLLNLPLITSLNIGNVSDKLVEMPSKKEIKNNVDIPLLYTGKSLDNYTIKNSLLQERSKTSKNQTLKGPENFEKAFEEAVKINPEVKKYKNFLIKTAKCESGFNSSVQNRAGAPYYGYFLMGRNEIKSTTGLSVEEFRKNPVLQILGAVELYKQNIKVMKAIGTYELGKQKGFSDDALVAGAWLGGPGGVRKFLKGLGDPSDSHWYGGKGGTSVGRRMKEFNS